MVNQAFVRLCLIVFLLGASHQTRGAEILKNYESVFPKKVLDDGELSDSLSTEINPGTGDGLHAETCTYQVEFEGVTYGINLELNVALLGKSLLVEDGSNGQTTSLNKQEIDFSQYIGSAHILGETSQSWDAWFDVKDVMNGVIVLPDPVAIKPHGNGHKAYRQSSVETNETSSCGGDLLINLPDVVGSSTADFDDDEILGTRKKRNIQDRTKYMETVFVITQDLFLDFGESPSAVTQAILRLANGVDCLYKSVGIRVVVHHIEYFSAANPNPFTIDLNDYSQTLNTAEAYIKNRRYLDPVGSPWKDYDHVVVLNGHSFVEIADDNSIVLGVARLQTMCSAHSLSYVAYQNSLDDNIRRSVVTAHEIGHSIGLIHNEVYSSVCNCGEQNCIMDAFVGFPYATKWTNCSTQSMTDEIQYSSGHCLLNVPETSLLQQISSCGNKYLEQGEECDCGTVSECESACCNPLTCQLHTFAQCDGSHACCDASTCQIAAAGTLCRQLCDNDCDLPEYCNGVNSTCPEDRHAEDGALCNSNLDRCKDGYCLTRTRQCHHILGGDTGITAAQDRCYLANARGDRFGNCGVNADGSYKACSSVDQLCGKLFCEGAGNTFRPASREGSRGSLTFASDGYRCYLYIEPPLPGVFDYSYVQDGSACYFNRGVCFEGACYISTSLCTNPCNGTCNDAGNCFCADGLAPPDCTSAGNGGSIDSGPPPTPAMQNCGSYSKATDAETLRSELEMQLVCSQKIEISFNLCPFLGNGYSVDDLVIIGANQEYDPLSRNLSVPLECVAKAEPYTADPWRAKIVFDARVCGGEAPTIDSTHVTRTGRFRAIRGGEIDETATIVRKRAEFFYDFRCKQEKSLYAQIATKPEKLVLLGYEDANRTYSVGRSFFRDLSLTQPIDVENDVINVGDRIHVLLELQESDPSLVLQTLDCWISDSADENVNPIYNVIDNRCPAEDALGANEANNVTQNCVGGHTQFSFLAFKYVGRSQAEQLLYLHCRLQTCQADLYDCSCPTCSTDTRKKRSDYASATSGRVETMGPFLFGN